MADTASTTAPNPVWTMLVALTPSLGSCLVVIVTMVVGIVGTLLTQRYVHPIWEAASTVGRPTPLVSAGDVDHIVGLKCDGILSRVDDILSRLPPKAGGKR